MNNLIVLYLAIFSCNNNNNNLSQNCSGKGASSKGHDKELLLKSIVLIHLFIIVFYC